MPKLFTRDEAERLLPKVEAALREAIFLRSEYAESQAEIEKAMRRVTMLGGVSLDRGHLIAQKNRQQASAERLNQTIEEIQSHGCVIKDLDTGLLDFPTSYRGTEVYLCWKLGEKRIDFWHSMDEGFGGRKPIDHEFLENHRGGITH